MAGASFAVADSTISGTISLPGSAVAPTGGMDMDIDAYDEYGNYYPYSSVTIPAGENSVDYTISVASDSTVEWTVVYHLWDGYPPSYINDGYYCVDGTTANYSEATTLAGGADHSGIQLTLLKGNSISGTISLPGSAVAPTGGMDMDIYAYDEYGNYYSYSSVTIPAGENSVDYTISVASDSTVEWTVVYYLFYINIWDNYPLYINNGYYCAGGTTANYSEASLLAGGSDYSDIDLSIPLSEDGKCVDIDGNGELSISDIILGLKVVTGEKIDSTTGDCNGDLKIGIQKVIFTLSNISN